MKVLTPGHKYALANHADPGACQIIQFIEKEPDPMNPGGLALVNDGTTNEELLRVLIDRLQFLNQKMPCRENSIAITHCEDALLRLESRTAQRAARGVEGTARA